MRKSIFFKLALLIIPITIIFNGAALFISYRVTYSDQISHFSETIKRVAASASYYLVMNYPLTYEEKMDTMCLRLSPISKTTPKPISRSASDTTPRKKRWKHDLRALW